MRFKLQSKLFIQQIINVNVDRTTDIHSLGLELTKDANKGAIRLVHVFYIDCKWC